MSNIKTPNKRKRWTAQAKMEIVLEGLKGQETVAELCRRVGISQSMYYEWKEHFIKHGLEGLKHGGKSAREKALEGELRRAQRTIGRLTLENEILKKTRNFNGARSCKADTREYRPLFSIYYGM
jgi:transposase-like protein